MFLDIKNASDNRHFEPIFKPIFISLVFILSTSLLQSIMKTKTAIITRQKQGNLQWSYKNTNKQPIFEPMLLDLFLFWVLVYDKAKWDIKQQ